MFHVGEGGDDDRSPFDYLCLKHLADTSSLMA